MVPAPGPSFRTAANNIGITPRKWHFRAGIAGIADGVNGEFGVCRPGEVVPDTGIRALILACRYPAVPAVIGVTILRWPRGQQAAPPWKITGFLAVAALDGISSRLIS
jgi:hypothetical protein